MLQKVMGAPSKQTPMTTSMETPDKEWDELLDEAIKDWVHHVSRTGIVQHRLVHNFREVVEKEMPNQDADRGRFKYLKREHKESSYTTPKRKLQGQSIAQAQEKTAPETVEI